MGILYAYILSPPIGASNVNNQHGDTALLFIHIFLLFLFKVLHIECCLSLPLNSTM